MFVRFSQLRRLFEDRACLLLKAFSLVELLVAMAVLSILLVLLAQMAGSVSSLYKVGRARSDANGIGRALLDTMTADLKHAIIRSDLAEFAEESDGTRQALRFYCQRLGDFGDSPPSSNLDAARAVSIVEYRFYLSGDKQGYLARCDRACQWSSPTNVIPVGQGSTNGIASTDLEETLIYEGVMGAKWNYLRADGTMTNRYAANATNPVVAVRYSLALLDADGLRVLKESGKLGDFIGVFTNADNIADWESELQSKVSQFPAKAVTGTRFYERFVTLPQDIN